jgi:hypothetical protein
MIETETVTVQELKKKVSGGGFRPFSIHTTDGQQFDVPHPEFILNKPSSLPPPGR